MLSRSVLSDFVTPWTCSLPGFSVHGILQARILEWVAMPSSRGPSPPGDRIQVSCLAGRFFTVWATREALLDGGVWEKYFIVWGNFSFALPWTNFLSRLFFICFCWGHQQLIRASFLPSPFPPAWQPCWYLLTGYWVSGTVLNAFCSYIFVTCINLATSTTKWW